MKYVTVILCTIVISACTSVPSSKLSGTPGCQTESSTANGQSVSTDFCIRTVMFKPSQYMVQVNGQSVFEGTDHQSSAFEKEIREGRVSGGCDAIITILDTKTKRPVPFASLPEELTSGCHVSADSSGDILPFKKDSTCNTVFYKHLSPIIGKVVPVELSRQCVVLLNNEVIFDGTFRF